MMSRTSHATPCPAPRVVPGHPISRQINRVSTNSEWNDDTRTADLDYTRAIQQEFKDSRPRRRANFPRKNGKHEAINIFEDVLEDQELVIEEPKLLGGKTLLSRPAQKMPMRQRRPFEKVEAQPLGEIGQARQRTSIVPNALAHEPAAKGAPTVPNAMKDGSKKDPRRRTIFVPDDTTVLTIHPGANDSRRLDDTFQLPDVISRPFTTDQGEAVMDAEYRAEKPARRPRASLAVAPKRVPLQHMVAKQGNVPGTDVAGQNGGKENLPPKHKSVESKDGKPVTFTSVDTRPSPSNARLSKPTAASQARQTVQSRKGAPLLRSQDVAQNVRSAELRGHVHTAPTTAKARHSPSPRSAKQQQYPQARNPTTQKVSGGRESALNRDKSVKHYTPPKKSALASIRAASKVSQYPVLAEDVAQPQLYEESWLTHQENALTELINEVFQTSCATLEVPSLSEKCLRERLIDIYHQPSTTALHRRLQASISYGALSRPRDLPSAPNPAYDIGLRKRFLGLWLDNYDMHALRVAVEVVVGRQLPKVTSSLRNSLEISEQVLDPAKERRALIGFFETFFILVEDASDLEPDCQEAAGDHGARRWRKTVLRSLMLVWLLDQAKACAAIPGCLFKRNSSLKTSSSVLNALSSMLIPSVGDITRALRHFDYAVNYAQDPLDEVRYNIGNIAVDFRDGIFLARLVEILVFLPTKLKHDYGGDATVTITFPDMTSLESAMYQESGAIESRVLSQHLVMPCLGRAQKIHNVHVALGALSGYGGGLRGPMSDLTADDIVDGHREKTLALLWSLVSHHGLNHLVDWDELKADLQQASQESPATLNIAIRHDVHEDLLLAWATAHCSKHGVQVNNFTTAFADKKAYALILDDYGDFLPSDQPNARTSPPLESRLRALGCSAAFVRQFAMPDFIPSRTTTVSNLAFLASRLLPLARRHNAAVRIQRCFRRLRSRVLASQRICLMRMARACATVVQTRNNVVSAAKVLQRTWRLVMDRRVARLNADVEGFQAAARAWMVRRTNAQVKPLGYQRNQSLRVMGGW